MTPALFAAKVLRHLRHAFVSPLNDRDRVILIIANIFGIFFASLQSMVLNYGVVGEGLQTAVLYQVLRFLLLGPIGFPLAYWLLSFSSGKWGLALLQIVGTCFFLFGMRHYILNSIGFMLLCGPFWAVSLRAYASRLSYDNHSRETVLLVYVSTLASALGCLCGGFFLDWNAYVPAMLLSGTGVTLATFFMMPHMKPEGVWDLVRKFVAQFFSRENPYRRALKLINIRWPTTQLTLLYAAVGALMDVGLPTWMGLVQMPPVSAGFSLGMRPVLGLVLTPIVGSLVERSSVRVGQLGAVFLLSGWLLLIVVLAYPFLLLPALALMAVGTNMVAPAEMGWWLKKRSAAGITAREILLAAARVPSIGLMFPFLFIFAPSLFPFIGLFASGLFFLGMRHVNRTVSFRSALGWRASNRSRLQQ